MGRPKTSTHGMTSYYMNHGCRCELCQKAHAEYMRPRMSAYRAAKRANRNPTLPKKLPVGTAYPYKDGQTFGRPRIHPPPTPLDGLEEFFTIRQLRFTKKLVKAEERVRERKFQLYSDGDVDPFYGTGRTDMDLKVYRR